MIDVRVERSTDTVEIRVAGEVDIAGCPTLESALDDTLADPPATLVLELSGVTFLDSRGIAVLVSARRDVEPLPTRLVLVGASRQALRALETMRLTGYFEFDPPLA